MSPTQKVFSSPTGFNSGNNLQGIYVGDGGFINQGIILPEDFVLPNFWNMIFVDAVGDIVVQLGSGAPFVFPAQVQGSILLVAAIKVLKTAVIGGIVYSTTSTQLRWGTPCNFETAG